MNAQDAKRLSDESAKRKLLEQIQQAANEGRYSLVWLGDESAVKSVASMGYKITELPLSNGWRISWEHPDDTLQEQSSTINFTP